MCLSPLGRAVSTFFKTLDQNSILGLISKQIAGKLEENKKPDTKRIFLVLVVPKNLPSRKIERFQTHVKRTTKKIQL